MARINTPIFFGSVIVAILLDLVGTRAPRKSKTGIHFRPAGSDGIAEDLTADLFHPMLGFKRSSLLYPAQYLEKHRSGNSRNFDSTQPWEAIILQATDDGIGMLCRPYSIVF